MEVASPVAKRQKGDDDGDDFRPLRAAPPELQMLRQSIGSEKPVDPVKRFGPPWNPPSLFKLAVGGLIKGHASAAQAEVSAVKARVAEIKAWSRRGFMKPAYAPPLPPEHLLALGPAEIAERLLPSDAAEAPFLRDLCAETSLDGAALWQLVCDRHRLQREHAAREEYERLYDQYEHELIALNESLPKLEWLVEQLRREATFTYRACPSEDEVTKINNFRLHARAMSGRDCALENGVFKEFRCPLCYAVMLAGFSQYEYCSTEPSCGRAFIQCADSSCVASKWKFEFGDDVYLIQCAAMGLCASRPSPTVFVDGQVDESGSCGHVCCSGLRNRYNEAKKCWEDVACDMTFCDKCTTNQTTKFKSEFFCSRCGIGPICKYAGESQGCNSLRDDLGYYQAGKLCEDCVREVTANW